MGEMVGGRRRRKEAAGQSSTPDSLMLDIMNEVEEKRERSKKEKKKALNSHQQEVNGVDKEEKKDNTDEETKRLLGFEDDDKGEVEDSLGELAEKKTSDVSSPSRQRKVSHRKVIIHDDGDICNTTYNKPCPYGHEDPLHSNPPMFHEIAGGGTLPPGMMAALSRMGGMGGVGGLGGGMNPELMMRMAAMAGGG